LWLVDGVVETLIAINFEVFPYSDELVGSDGFGTASAEELVVWCDGDVAVMVSLVDFPFLALDGGCPETGVFVDWEKLVIDFN
jgi:hypothetical protein